MARLLNALLGRPYCYDDLVKVSASFLSNPKIPAGLPETMAHFDGGTRTFLEFIQLIFKDLLRQIADKRTRAEQRTELLSLCLQEHSWNAAYRAVKNANHIDSWAHFAEGSAWFEPYPKTEWKRLIVGRYMAALIIGSWLTVLGRNLYQLEDYIELALDLFVDYDAQIKTLDVSLGELMLENVANHQDDQARHISNLKDDVLNPLIKEQYAILEKLGADIKANTIDVNFYQGQFTRIDEIKQHIARAIRARGIPASEPW